MLHARRPRGNWHQQFTTGTRLGGTNCGTQGPTNRRILQKQTHTHMHYGIQQDPLERCHTSRRPQKQWHSDTMTEHLQHTVSPRVAHTCHCQSETHTESAGYSTQVGTHTNTLPPDLLMKEA